jgi:hypothetical protein
MPNAGNLNNVIRSLVAKEVAVVLAPYANVLGRVAAFLGTGPAKRGPGRPPKALAAAKPVRQRRRRGAKAKSLVRLAKNFSVGQRVIYKQGRGAFEAKVADVDEAKGMLKLVRAKDGKKVARPATKVVAA